MNCELETTCKLIYNKYKRKCYLYNKKLKKCKLKRDFFRDKISDVGIDILQNNIREVNKSNSNGGNGVVCPRSKNKISIVSCNLNNCPYHSNIVYYNCIIIHSNHFFNGTIPKHLILLKDANIKKKIFISISLCRMIFLMNIYYSEYVNGTSKSFNVKKKKLLLCPICGKLHNNSKFIECECGIKRILRKRKILEKRWRKSLTMTDKSVKDTEYIKQFLAELKNLEWNIKSVPLGYLVKMYDVVFKEKLAEAFGFDSKIYEKMVKEWI